VLLGTATDIGDPGIDEVYGYGSLDAGFAVLGPGKFDWGNFSVSFNGGQSDWFNDITGAGGLVKSGDGVLAMFGNSTYSGQTHIDGGILTLGGSITSDTFVSADGTLSGNGTIYGNVDNQGTVFGGWGGEGGTLTIDGNYHQSADASIRVKIGAKEGTSRIDVSGTAVLDGGTVNAYFDPVIYRGDTTYTILSSGGLSGAFAPDVLEDYAFLDLSLGYDARNAYLNVFRNGTTFSDVGKTSNQKAVGAGIESFGGLALSTSAGSTDPSALIYDLIIGLNEEAARSAFDSLSGEIHSSVKSALIEESRFTRDVVSARLRTASGSVTSKVPGLAYGPDGSVAADASSSVWGQAYGSAGHLEGPGTARTSRSSGGLFVGADGDVGANWQAGFAAGYGGSSIDVKGRASSANINNYTVAAYAGTQPGALAFRFGAAHTWHEVETDRLTALGASGADYGARTAQAFGEVGYSIDLDRVAFEPFANLAYVHLQTEGMGDVGSVGLKSQSGNNNNLFTTLGVRVQGDIPTGDNSRLTARGMLGWRHAFGDVSPETELTFASGSAFSVEGSPLARDAFIVEAGIDYSLTKAITLGVSYSGQISSAVQAHGVRGDLVWRF
jgi:subtilase-type serine protease